MPELPEVEITTRKLQPLRGKRIVSFWSDWPRGLRVVRNSKKISRDIAGRRVLRIWRHGKVTFFDLGSKDGRRSTNSDGRFRIAGARAERVRRRAIRMLAFHQRMSGSFEIVNSKWKIENRHVHVKLRFADGTGLWLKDTRKFGVVWYGKPENVLREKYLASLGPDALSITFKEFAARLKKHSGMIKPLLLRQDVFAGIGNIMADESLWRAKVHPRKLVARFRGGDLKVLFAALKNTLRLAIRAQGTTIRHWGHPDGKEGEFQEYFRVYDRRGEKCFRCKTKIVRTVIGSRGTWICPRCQNARSPTSRI